MYLFFTNHKPKVLDTRADIYVEKLKKIIEICYPIPMSGDLNSTRMERFKLTESTVMSTEF